MDSTESYEPGTLRASLDYTPQILKFGTSGRRGKVVDLTQLEIYINVTAELEYLKALPRDQGGIVAGDEFYYARDLRPSSSEFVADEDGRGEIAQAVERAVIDAGLTPVNMGKIPTPALTFYAITHDRGSIMVTGSHIPFDRNGYKTNSAHGELLKKDEGPINERVAKVRDRIYRQPASGSLFNSHGMLKSGHRDLVPENDAARAAYFARYTNFFEGRSLSGKRIVVYQHSAVARDLLVEMLKAFDADVVPAGRSDTFVPIDTENIDAAQLETIQKLADAAVEQYGPVDAVISADGDSDRPLVLGLENGKVRFFGGDLLGMIVAEYLGADAVVVPISCNDAIDRGNLKDKLQPKTKIGSPYVIAGMEKARAQGKQAVCGWEANGGFLLGSDVTRGGHPLEALATRDAFLPILSVLFAAFEKDLTVPQLFDRLPKRYSKAALLTNFARPVSLEIVKQFSPTDARIQDIVFTGGKVQATDENEKALSPSDDETVRLTAIRDRLQPFFPVDQGFGKIVRLNYIDGVRIYFDNGDVAHVRPSGNADELRIYAVADTQERAEAIAKLGVAEPDGILRRLEKEVGK